MLDALDIHSPHLTEVVRADCGERGEIKDRGEAPAGYAEVTRTAASFVSPKNRGKAKR